MAVQSSNLFSPAGGVWCNKKFHSDLYHKRFVSKKFISILPSSTYTTFYSGISSSLSLFLFVLLLLISFAYAHYNQPQYGVPVQQQQQQVIYHQQQQPQYQQQQQVYHQQQTGEHIAHYQQAPAPGSNVLHDSGRIHDKEHIKEHLHEALGDQDVNKLSEEELQFHYFKMHDNDNNNMLDGSELIKSLIHWHVEESKQMGHQAPPHGTTKVFTDAELEQMIDPILQMDDKNNDGYIDYPEFVAAQKARGF